MIFSKTERLYLKRFNTYPNSDSKRHETAIKKIKRTRYWIMFIPIITLYEVVEQTDFERKTW